MDVDLSMVNILLLVIVGIVSALVSFFVFVFYFNEDAKYERIYGRAYRRVKNSKDFPVLEAVNPKRLVVSSSDNRFSRFRAGAKTLFRKYEREDVTLVPFHEQTEQVDKEKRILIEVVSKIPGKFLFSLEFRESLVNYLGFKVCLEDPEVSDMVKEYFASRQELSKWGPRIANLDGTDAYKEASLSPDSESKRSLLKDVIIPMVSRLWYDNIQLIDPLDRQSRMSELRSMIMEIVHGLYIGRIKVVPVNTGDTKSIVSNLIRDIRDENNYGYLFQAHEDHFGAFKSVIVTAHGKLEYWWGLDDCYCLSPHPDQQLPMRYNKGTFVCYVKKKKRFAKPSIPERLKKKRKYRKIGK